MPRAASQVTPCSAATATSETAAHPTAGLQAYFVHESVLILGVLTLLQGMSCGSECWDWRERSLLAQLRKSESRCTEKEAEWRERERELRKKAAEVEARLGQCQHDCSPQGQADGVPRCL